MNNLLCAAFVVVSFLYIFFVRDAVFLQANTKILVNHARTNTSLCLEVEHSIRFALLTCINQ